MAFPQHNPLKKKKKKEAAASLIFSEEKMQLIIKIGLYSRAAFIVLVARLRRTKGNPNDMRKERSGFFLRRLVFKGGFYSRKYDTCYLNSVFAHALNVTRPYDIKTWNYS